MHRQNGTVRVLNSGLQGSFDGERKSAEGNA